MPLTVLYIGNFLHTYSTETHVAASLREMGHTVIQAQENRYNVAKLNELSWAKPDLLLYTRTWGIPEARADGGDLDPIRWFRELEGRGTITASYHLDLYAGLDRGGPTVLAKDPFWQTKYVFSADGGSDDFFRRNNINHFWLRAGVFGQECAPVPPQPGPRPDVCFVGSGGTVDGYHRQWQYRDQLIAFLRETYGSRFVKYGGARERRVRGRELNALYASARVVVGDTLCLGPGDSQTPLFQHERYWSDRIYETMGRGGFIVHPAIRGLELEFTDGEHLRFYRYGDFDGLRRIIDESLADDAGRERMRAAGHRKVTTSCTYVHRLTEMLTTLASHEPRLRQKLGA